MRAWILAALVLGPVPAAAQHNLGATLEVRAVASVMAPDCPGAQAQELQLNAQAAPAFTRRLDTTWVRVRKGGSVNSVQFPLEGAERNQVPTYSGVAGFLWGKPVDVRVTLCGSFPDVTYHRVTWALEAEDDTWRVAARGALPDDQSILYTFSLRESGPTTHDVSLWGMSPIRVDVETIATGAVQQVDITMATPAALKRFEDKR